MLARAPVSLPLIRGLGCAAGTVSAPSLGPCFWATVNVNTVLRGMLTPSRACSSGWEFLVTPEGTRRPPQSRHARLQVIYSQSLEPLHVTTVPTTPTSKIAFIVTLSQRLHVKGWAREESCIRASLKGDGSVRRWGAGTWGVQERSPPPQKANVGFTNRKRDAAVCQ